MNLYAAAVMNPILLGGVQSRGTDLEVQKGRFSSVGTLDRKGGVGEGLIPMMEQNLLPWEA